MSPKKHIPKPRKPEEERQVRNVSFRCTEEQYLALEEAGKLGGRLPGAEARFRCFPPVPPPQEAQ
jgi:hypothetical protein